MNRVGLDQIALAQLRRTLARTVAAPRVTPCPDPYPPTTCACRVTSWHGMRGLQQGDARLLQALFERIKEKPARVWTNVPLCWPTEECPHDYCDWQRRQYQAAWARRIDAVIQWPAETWIVEAKVQADHYALGQCLFYAWHAPRTYENLADARTVCITDRLAPDLDELYSAYGIDVVELPFVLDDIDPREGPLVH